jgi:fucose permease
MLVSLQSIGNLAAIGLMGILPTFLGRRRSVLITSFWMGIAYLLFTTGWGGPMLLPAACFLMGIAKGGNANFANTMMSTLPGSKASVGYNLSHGAYAIGALAAPLLVIACTKGNPNGWRYATGILLVLSIAQLADYLWVPLPAETIQKKATSLDRSFLKRKSFWLATAILFFYVSTEYAINGWLVTYFQDIGILSNETAQLMSSLLWLVMFIGRMIGAAIVGKISRRALLVADGVGLMFFFLLVFFSRSEAAIFLGIAGTGLFMATIYTSAMALGTESVRGNDLGVSWMTLAGSAGGILTPAAVGFVAERAGIQAGMGIVAAMTVLLFAAILISFFIGRSTDA